MPNQSSNGRKDFNELAFVIAKIAEGDFVPDEAVKNPAAVALGRLGGLKGGAKRASVLSAERRSEIAKTAALKRWEKKG
jgi:hypothetical protein